MASNYFSFKILSRDKKTKAKTGVINTLHGKINTPAFVPVGTAATIKSLTPEEIKNCGIEVFIVNTYHMIFRPGVETVKKGGGLHGFMNWKFPLMTDSGGFQAFSLGEYGPRNVSDKSENMVKITDQGIEFKSAWDGKKIFFGPHESILAQHKLGADLIMAFDECTFYPIKKSYAKRAMQRTHDWAKTCLQVKKQLNNKQTLYGIIQGSVFEDLRRNSANFFAGKPFEGFAVGSVANSREPRKKVFQVLDWTLPILLPVNKPIHFLGIGEVEDIFIAIEKGIDSFDCVIPTRLARMGWIFTKSAGLKNKFRFDITKSRYHSLKSPPDRSCRCYTCTNFTKSYLNHLFRCRELLGYRLATIHNLYFYANLMSQIRTAIENGEFLKLKQEWLKV